MSSAFGNRGSPNAPPTPRRPPAAGGHQVRSATIKAPEGLEAVKTKNRSVKVRWNPVNLDQLPAGYQLLGYCLEQRIMETEYEGPKPWVSAQGLRKVLDPAIADFTVVDLTPYEDYLICVRSAALQQERVIIGKRSVPIHVVTRKPHQPYRPRSVQMDDTHGSLILTWEEPSPAADVSPGSYEYVVEMCLYVDDKTLREWTECCKTKQCKFPIKEHQMWKIKVNRSGDYRFRVSANNPEPENSVRSLPQEMGDPEIPIRIEAPWSKQLLNAAAEALWRLPGRLIGREHGSIIFVISCHDVISLRDLWMNYRLGKVKKFFQNLFTHRTRPASVVTDTELKINIEEQDFYSCRRHLLLTRPTDKGFRVARLGDTHSRGKPLGLSEDYPVYCKPTSHRTTCPRLDFLDPAVSTTRLKVKHEEHVRLRPGRGLDRTTSVDNLLVLPPPSRQVDHSSLRALDLAVVGREDRSCADGADDVSTLKFRGRQVQAVVRTGREKSEGQARQLQEQGQMQTAREDTEVMVHLLRKEVIRLTEQKDKADKILVEHKLEIQQLKGVIKIMKVAIEELLYDKYTAKALSQGQGHGREGDPAEEKASASEEKASTSEEKASTSEEKASTSEEKASTSEEKASTSELSEPEEKPVASNTANKDVTDFFAIVASLNLPWEGIGRNLSLPDATIERIRQKHKDDTSTAAAALSQHDDTERCCTQCCLAALEEWQHLSGTSASIEGLKTALRAPGQGAIAEELSKREQLMSEMVSPSKLTSMMNLHADVYDVIQDRMRSVCRINWPGGSGTGFLLSKGKILTCYHVYKLMIDASRMFTDISLFTATFFVSSAEEYKVSFPSTTLKCHSEESDLNYAILQLSVDDETASVIDSLPCLGRYISESEDNRNMVVIVGHPYSGSKMVDFCPIVGMDQRYIIHARFRNPEFPHEDPRKPLYHTGVMFHGSSGSPGFDTKGNVALMHTRGFYSDMSRQSIVEQGVSLSAIRDHARQNLAPDDLSEIFPDTSDTFPMEVVDVEY
ncbi:uncharacterized protein LOC118405358 [Branchiostoma floridae]|uniref:Uncharacterized protein LOC118405358 n=1 Tax=Branchiostoma floridae TaxID=7739 RepID=A0A9J7KIJ5_BRAFL|nr:uncharacterized protein LOC118405358 [Branchiostoma floridae]